MLQKYTTYRYYLQKREWIKSKLQYKIDQKTETLLQKYAIISTQKSQKIPESYTKFSQKNFKSAV